MITVESETRDRYCSACAYHRKPNKDQLKFFKIKYATSKDSSVIVLRLCNECRDELVQLLSR